jgi:uncharacterized protein (TIGR02996 family)
MFHPDEFWHAILTSPLHDAPRLRYAAWLEKNHDPLGEFIQVQCRLAPMDGSPRQLLDWETRQQQLLNDHEDRWTEVFDGKVEWWSFRRGFIEEISLDAQQLLRHADALFQQAPLQDIHLRTSGDEFADLPALADPRHTFFLDLSSNPLRDAGLQRLAASPLLRSVHGLNLNSCQVSDDGLWALSESPFAGNLRELYLNDNPLTDHGLRALTLSNPLQNLRELFVSMRGVGPDGIESLRCAFGSRLCLEQ